MQADCRHLRNPGVNDNVWRRRCENSIFESSLEESTLQNALELTIVVRGDVLVPIKTLLVGVFTQPRPVSARPSTIVLRAIARVQA